MKNRRDFIKNTALIVGGLSVNNWQSPIPNTSIPLINTDPDVDPDYFWNSIRLQFPLNKNKIFLNNGTIGPSPFSVLNAVQNEMLDVETNVHYGGHEQASLDALARILSCKSDEISLTKNVTEGINIACWGAKLVAGDEVIISQHEHVGNAGPWLSRAHHDGIVLKPIPLGKTAEETLDIVKKAINKKTKVIALPHIPCTIGQVLPMQEICKLARAQNIITIVDGAHPLGMLKMDLKTLDCDVYVGCCHKWLLGPKGTGFLYVASGMRDKIDAYYGGAGVDTGWELIKEVKMKAYVNTGHKYYYGTHNSALLLGIVKAIEFHEMIGSSIIETRIKSLAEYLQKNLMNVSKDIEMLTPIESISRAAIIAFKIKGKEMTHLHKHLMSEKITTRYVAENDINCLRVSTHIYNNQKEIDDFIQQVEIFIKQP